MLLESRYGKNVTGFLTNPIEFKNIPCLKTWSKPITFFSPSNQFFFGFFFLFIGVTLVHRIIQVSGTIPQVSGTIHHLYTVSCVHCPKSSLLSLSFIPLFPPNVFVEDKEDNRSKKQLADNIN